MQKLKIISVVIFIAFSSHAQHIEIPFGKTPVIDGVSDQKEWDDAAEKTINVSYNWDVTVLFKHNDTALYFAFYNLKTIYGERYPDILLDTDNDKDTFWQSDDWWFHASYNDCEGKGIYNNWQSCVPEHPGWTANNFPLSEPGFIEIEISYAKIGLTEKSCDTFGIALDVSNTYDDYDFYPLNAIISDPSSWTTAVLSKATGIHPNGKHENYLMIYPNPAIYYTTVSYSNYKSEKHTLTVYNSSGQLSQLIENADSTGINLDVSAWAEGLYFFKMEFSNGEIISGKLLITD